MQYSRAAAGESDPQPCSRSWTSSQSWKHKVPTHHHHWWSTRPTHHHHQANISPSFCQHSIFNLCQDASRSPHQCTCKRLLRHLNQNTQVRIKESSDDYFTNLINYRQYIDAFNASCLSWVPEQGTVSIRTFAHYCSKFASWSYS